MRISFVVIAFKRSIVIKSVSFSFNIAHDIVAVWQLRLGTILIVNFGCTFGDRDETVCLTIAGPSRSLRRSDAVDQIWIAESQFELVLTNIRAGSHVRRES